MKHPSPTDARNAAELLKLDRVVSADRHSLIRCDQCTRPAVPGQMFCTDHLRPDLTGAH